MIDQKKNFAKHADLVGALASALCLAHCLATPFILAITASLATSNTWWKSADYLLLGISLGAVVFSVQRNKQHKWMAYAMYGAWLALCGVLVNEKFGFVPLVEEAVYLPSLGLAVLHLYNRKTCR